MGSSAIRGMTFALNAADCCRGVLEEGPNPSFHRVTSVKKLMKLFRVAVPCCIPIGVIRKFVAKDSRSTQRKRKSLTEGRIAGGRRIAGQRHAIAVRVLHPVIAYIKAGQRPSTFRAGVVIGHWSIRFRGLPKK